MYSGLCSNVSHRVSKACLELIADVDDGWNKLMDRSMLKDNLVTIMRFSYGAYVFYQGRL